MSASHAVHIGLSAVLVAVQEDTPLVLVTRRDTGEAALPFGGFDPVTDLTLERSLRGWVRAQTGFELGYAEQLYTFGDKDRERPEARLSAAPEHARVISIGYLALTPEARRIEAAFSARWQDWYQFFPWEDHRDGRPALIEAAIRPRLMKWAEGNAARHERVRVAFALSDARWDEERVLDRYELLYEAGLVAECARDRGLADTGARLGEMMASDHRRILATAISRLRGKLKYRPVIFELMPERFTLSHLQHTVESVLGLQLHTQNFRRALDKTGLVEGTGERHPGTGGRPAEQFVFRRDYAKAIAAPGLSTPRKPVE